MSDLGQVLAILNKRLENLTAELHEANELARKHFGDPEVQPCAQPVADSSGPAASSGPSSARCVP